MRDLFEEIASSIRKNKLRTALTGFSVAWGIFMLIVLLASGNGLRNGMLLGFGHMSTNSLSISPGSTSIPYNGMQKNRRIRIDQSDGTYLKQHLHEHIEGLVPVLNKNNTTVSFRKEYVNITITGVTPEFLALRNLELLENQGRFINVNDLEERRKVIAIHKKTADILFRGGETAVGSFVVVNKIPYRVIGVYDEPKGGNQNPPAYIPISTAIAHFSPSGYISNLNVTLKELDTKEESEAFVKQVRQELATKHAFSPDDMNAVWIRDRLSDFLQVQGIFNGINLFIWIIGIGTLIAGIVGISNIMMITVKERTKEFGIRKALGATPSSILVLVLTESVVITSMFGYIGLVLGIGLTEMVSAGMAQAALNAPVEQGSPQIFKDPTVDLNIVLAATVVLIISGLFAGYVPAKRAVSIKPIEALRGE